MDSTNYSGNSSILPKAFRLGIHGGNDHVPNLLCYLEGGLCCPKFGRRLFHHLSHDRIALCQRQSVLTADMAILMEVT
jgi:hypothetical protein